MDAEPAAVLVLHVKQTTHPWVQVLIQKPLTVGEERAHAPQCLTVTEEGVRDGEGG